MVEKQLTGNHFDGFPIGSHPATPGNLFRHKDSSAYPEFVWHS